MSHTKPRYPGAQPFETAQQDIFFGREQDIEALCRKIRQEPLTVLYSKSGLGKSSLLNAGVTPRIEAELEYRPVRIRFNAYDKDLPAEGQIMPDVRCRKTARGGDASVHTFLDQLIEDEPTLWHDLKEQQILAHEKAKGDTDKKTPLKLLLIFDQFEELFTYPPEAVLSFRKQLAEALNTPLPSRYWDMLELFGQDEAPFTDEQLALLQRPLDLRVVMAIRQDRMHLLGQLSDYLPSVSKTWYELRPLNNAQATQAIIAPAAIVGDFKSPVFSYDGPALSHILNFLTKSGSEKIESTQLQIVCNSIEQTATDKAAQGDASPLITNAEVGDLEAVIEDYYMQKIGAIEDPAERQAARELVEDGLIYEEEERRLSLYEGIILSKYGITASTLRQLVDGHLLRAEPSLQGGYTYELSHDTLVAPVLKAKEKRMEEEALRDEEELRYLKELEMKELRQQAEIERKRAEDEKQLRETAQLNEQRARQRTRLAIFVSIFALALAGLAFWFFQRSVESEEKALGAQYEAEANLDLAVTRGKEAEDNLNLAVQREAEAKANFERAEKGEADAQRNFIAAQKARQEAEANLTKATQANSSTVILLLENADRDILKLDYEAALQKIKAAASLEARKPEVAKAFLEIAFWHGEAGNIQRATALFDSATVLVNKKAKIVQPFRASIEAFDIVVYKKLMERYYPVMVKVEGGTFDMGCDPGDTCQSLHQQEVSNFQIAKYETTWWQYYLFCQATGHEYKSPGWGTDGDNPAVNVNWFDAVRYCNWVSRKLGEEEAITKNDADIYEVNLRAGYRLPTEAEWEFAAKGGKLPDNTIYSGSNELGEVGWFGENSGSRTHPFGKKKANALGLYDMSGNVWEWCWDWKTEYPVNPPPDYKGPEDGVYDYRVLRGGSWNYDDYSCRVSNRSNGIPDFRLNYNGFRCARVF